MPYIIVTEYTNKALGLKGVRQPEIYQNQNVYKATFDDYDGKLVVIAQGISAYQASNLVALTPGVCRLTAAVQNLCDPNGVISNLRMADFHVNQALFRISEDSTQRLANNLIPVTPFPFVEIPDDLSDRSELFRFIKYTFDSPDGRVDNKTGLVYSNLMEMIKSLYCVPDLSSMVSDKKKKKTKKKKSIPLT